MTIKNIIIIGFLSLIFNLKSQTSFNNEPKIFIEEYTKYLSQSKRKDFAKEIEYFKTNWTTNLYSEDEKMFIIRTVNNMMFKNLGREPYHEMTLLNLNLIRKEKINPTVLKQWQIISKSLLDKNPKEYLTFLNTFHILVSEKTLYKTEDKKWLVNNLNFDLLFKNNRVSFVFKAVELTYTFSQDRIRVWNCAGQYFPDKANWIGSQGRVNWERVGLLEKDIYCEFGTHNFDFTKNSIQVDSALLFYPKVSATKLLGSFIDQITFSETKEALLNSTFPKFKSYNPTIEIKGIVGDQAIYKGGFSISGKKVTSQNIGESDAKATIILLYKGKPLVEVTSESFRLDSGMVKTQAASIKIKADTGYITHPKVIFSYNIEKKKMIVYKGVDGFMRMPFTDNYHGVEIDVEQVIWDQSKPYIDFDMISNEKAAYVETNTFYKQLLFEQWQGALNHNPLEKFYTYCRKVNVRNFTLQDYAYYLEKDKKHLFQLTMDLVDKGFITYNQENDSIFVKNKLYYWISNNMGTRDYDVIRFNSIIAAKPNITYNLNSFELKMEGVRKFIFSDSQNVIATPHEQIVVIKKDKNLNFAGMVRAGRIDFYSKEFNFNYSTFQIENTTMDSMVIYYPDLNTNALRKVQSVLSNTYGRILIDKPNNKSGRKDYAEYPIFIAERGSEIHYDRAATHNHAYKADKFKFEVDPFEIDSLDNFTIAGFGFGGTLVSDGIFPDIKNTARIQPDYSLGFVDKVSLPMYDNKGKAEMTINLSNRGFYGSGEIKYETSTSTSPEYLLLPDATVGTSTSFTLPESSKYPVVNASNIKTEWFPKKDVMYQTVLDSSAKVFRMNYDFNGKLALSPKDLKGDGSLTWSKAIFSSQEMTFGRNKSTAPVSSIKIFALDPTKFSFESNNMNGVVDFDKQEGKFIANNTGSYTQFPYNAYSSNMNDYKWDMIKNTMEIKPNAAMAGIKPMFSGLPANQPDSLKFECAYAKLDLNTFVLYMEKIPYIDVADSRIFPFEGKAIVREKAAMDRLDSSKIDANKNDKYHTLKNCQVNILGGNKLSANGYYRYIDKYKMEQPLYVDSIKINENKNLVGFGKINEASNFNLDKKIGFKGLFSIVSTTKPIKFTGYITPRHQFEYMPSRWVRYINEVDPQNVVINISDPRDYDNKKLAVGLYFANDSNHVYPRLFNLKRIYSDPELQSDTGIFFYDASKDAFFAGNADKLLGKSLKGNFIQFNEKDKSVYCEGKFNFGTNLYKSSIKNAGFAQLKAKDSVYRFKLASHIDIPIPAAVNSAIVKFLTKEDVGKPGTNLNTTENQKAILELIENLKEAEKMVNTLQKTGTFTPDEEFKKGFLFTDVNLMYVPKYRKFIGAGTTNIPLFNGTVINKTYNLTFAIEKKRSGDKIYIYLEGENNEYLYIEFSKSNMAIGTNNKELHEAISLASEKNTDPEFSFRLATERMKENFLTRNEIEEGE